jgi:hypothetical protein
MVDSSSASRAGQLDCSTETALPKHQPRVRPTKRVSLAAVVVMFVLAPVSAGLAHNLSEQRSVILSLAPDGIDLLVAYELPAGARAMELRDIIDMDRSGAVDSRLEELARVQLLHARLRAGLDVVVDGEPVLLELERIEFRDGAGEGARQGFEGMALFRVEREFESNRETQVSLQLVEGSAQTQAEVQILPGLTIVSSALPVAVDAPVVGPAEVLPSLPLTVTVRRD